MCYISVMIVTLNWRCAFQVQSSTFRFQPRTTTTEHANSEFHSPAPCSILYPGQVSTGRQKWIVQSVWRFVSFPVTPILSAPLHQSHGQLNYITIIYNLWLTEVSLFIFIGKEDKIATHRHMFVLACRAHTLIQRDIPGQTTQYRCHFAT